MTKIEKLCNNGLYAHELMPKLNEVIDAVNKLTGADDPPPSAPRWAVVDIYRGYLFSDTLSKSTVSFADRADAEALRDLLTKGGMPNLRVFRWTE